MEQYQKIYLYKRVVKAKLYIDSHFTEEIDLDNIADQAHFSKFHFIRLFKSIYGQTPKNYLIIKRMQEAKKHLANGHSVLEAGLMVGLESPTSFTNMFKKLSGQTPSAFQKNEIRRNLEIRETPLRFVPNCFAENLGWAK